MVHICILYFRVHSVEPGFLTYSSTKVSVAMKICRIQSLLRALNLLSCLLSRSSLFSSFSSSQA